MSGARILLLKEATKKEQEYVKRLLQTCEKQWVTKLLKAVGQQISNQLLAHQGEFMGDPDRALVWHEANETANKEKTVPEGKKPADPIGWFDSLEKRLGDMAIAPEERIRIEQERAKDVLAANYLYAEKGLLLNIREGWPLLIDRIIADAAVYDDNASDEQKRATSDFIDDCKKASKSSKYSCPAEFLAERLDPHSRLRANFIERVQELIVRSRARLSSGAVLADISLDTASIDAYRNVAQYMREQLDANRSTYEAKGNFEIRANIIEELDKVVKRGSVPMTKRTAAAAAAPITPKDFITSLESKANGRWVAGQTLTMSPWAMLKEVRTRESIETALVTHLRQYAESTQRRGASAALKIVLDNDRPENRRRMAQYIEDNLLPTRTRAGGAPKRGEGQAHAAMTNLVHELRTRAGASTVEEIFADNCIIDNSVWGDKSTFVHLEADGLRVYKIEGNKVVRYNPGTGRYSDVMDVKAVFIKIADQLERSARNSDSSRAKELRDAAADFARKLRICPNLSPGDQQRKTIRTRKKKKLQVGILEKHWKNI